MQFNKSNKTKIKFPQQLLAKPKMIRKASLDPLLATSRNPLRSNRHLTSYKKPNHLMISYTPNNNNRKVVMKMKQVRLISPFVAP